MNAPRYIVAHSQYTEADYAYLRSKGWSNAKIAARWNEEQARGCAPQQVNKYWNPAPDLVSYLVAQSYARAAHHERRAAKGIPSRISNA